MTHINLKLSPRELEMLTVLASDQLFRREFIDPRMPGSTSNPADLTFGKKLLERLRIVLDRSKRTPTALRRNGLN